VHLLAQAAVTVVAGVAAAPRRLFISEAGVKTHLPHVYAKLGVNDRAAAADERGLLTRAATATSAAGGPAWPPGRGRGRRGPACAGGAGSG
jgi:hypothetical protein